MISRCDHILAMLCSMPFVMMLETLFLTF